MTYLLVHTLLFFCIFWLGYWLRSRRGRGKPRTLVALNIVPIAGSNGPSPAGLDHVIDGVMVREGDYVVLTRQSAPGGNGWWLVRQGYWVRPNTMRFTSGAGVWVIPTAGSQVGILWIHEADNNSWNSISTEQNVRFISFNDSNIAPSDPLEAAAFLLRLGVRLDRVQGSRTACISNLVRMGNINAAQGDLLVAKADNLTTHVPAADGSVVHLQQVNWTSQVRAYMTSLQDTYERFTVAQEIRNEGPDKSPFRGRVDLNNSSTPDGNPRRSRYERDPVI